MQYLLQYYLDSCEILCKYYQGYRCFKIVYICGLIKLVQLDRKITSVSTPVFKNVHLINLSDCKLEFFDHSFIHMDDNTNPHQDKRVNPFLEGQSLKIIDLEKFLIALLQLTHFSLTVLTVVRVAEIKSFIKLVLSPE